MRDLDKVQRLLASAPACQARIEALLARDRNCSAAEFAELTALWQEAHGPCPNESLMAGFGWSVREENTLRWCLSRLHISIAADPAHGRDGDHVLPLGRERLECTPHKHVISED